MQVQEYCLSEYYNGFITIEADELTDNLNSVIEIQDTDCYALCSAYCDEDGFLMFHCLAVGPDWETCTRGLEDDRMLGAFGIDEVFNLEARIVEPDAEMIGKLEPYIAAAEEGLDEDFLKTRTDLRLDYIRDLYYPDVVLVGLIDNNVINEYTMKITGIKGPFLLGELQEEPDADYGVHTGDPMYALPYYDEEGIRLFAMFGGNDLTEKERNSLDQIINETARYGIDFNGISLKS